MATMENWAEGGLQLNFITFPHSFKAEEDLQIILLKHWLDGWLDGFCVKSCRCVTTDKFEMRKI